MANPNGQGSRCHPRFQSILFASGKNGLQSGRLSIGCPRRRAQSTSVVAARVSRSQRHRVTLPSPFGSLVKRSRRAMVNPSLRKSPRRPATWLKRRLSARSDQASRSEVPWLEILRERIAGNDTTIFIQRVHHLPVANEDADVGRGIPLPNFHPTHRVVKEDVAWLQAIQVDRRSHGELSVGIRGNSPASSLEDNPGDEAW